LVETERLVIRLPEAADVPAVIGYYRDNFEHLKPYSPAFEPEMFDPVSWHEQVGQRRRELTYGESLRAFIEGLAIPADAKTRLAALTPATYIGDAAELARRI